MIINKTRRQLMTNLGLLFAYVKFSTPLAFAQTTEELKPLVNGASNFHGVYDNPTLKK